MTSVTLTIPAPGGKWIRTNQHQHWRADHALRTMWKNSAVFAAEAQLPMCRILSPFAVAAVVHKATRAVWDLDGVVPSIKAAIDGCRGTGLIEDDDWRHMARLTVEPGEPRKDAPALVLTFTELEEAP